MAITKILARRSGLDVAVKYVINADKTEDGVLTAYLNCTPRDTSEVMRATKKRYGKTDGVQCYHIIQSFAPGEVSQEQALEIAKAFAEEHLSEFETVIGVHNDKHHVHAHIVFNSVSCVDGHKYHSNANTYYGQIRSISDRLCSDNGLSVIITGEPSHSVKYIEWIRTQRGQPTFKSMLEEDIRLAIDDANDFGHFMMIMENMGYEIKFGKHLSFRLRGQDRYIRPGRRNEEFTEDGIRSAIEGRVEAIERGVLRDDYPRRAFTPFQEKTKLTGFMRLYVHYLYLLGKIEQRQYPPRMTSKMKQDVMRFEQLKNQYAFLQKHDINSPEDLSAYRLTLQTKEQQLLRQRSILNTRRKQQKKLYDALADEKTYSPVKTLYEDGLTGIESEFVKYMDAVAILNEAAINRDSLSSEKAKVYGEIADVNRQIRETRKESALCDSISDSIPKIEKQIAATEHPKEKEVLRDEFRRG